MIQPLPGAFFHLIWMQTIVKSSFIETSAEVFLDFCPMSVFPSNPDFPLAQYFLPLIQVCQMQSTQESQVSSLQWHGLFNLVHFLRIFFLCDLYWIQACFLWFLCNRLYIGHFRAFSSIMFWLPDFLLLNGLFLQGTNSCQVTHFRQDTSYLGVFKLQLLTPDSQFRHKSNWFREGFV